MTLIDRNSAITSGDPHIALKQLYGIRTRYSDSSYKSDQADNGGRPDTGRSGPNRRSMESVTGMLERIGCGYLVLDRDKSVVEWNDAAQKTLEGPGEAVDTSKALSCALRRLVANVPGHFPTGSLSWVVIPSRGDRPMILNEEGIIVPGGTSIIALLDRENRSTANPQTLQRMFGLTRAETHLALRLAHGDAPLEIARSWRLSRTTIRSQLASLFAKTDTKRQAELVALLGRISVLP